ncbi:MAG: hypothetical protein IPN29_01975 [Saprospiraceae bacterium]|nr:hypothetical protein [Saprospiraceae bacterium]
MAKTVKEAPPINKPEVLTKEITTNPVPDTGFLVNLKVLKDLGHHCYACTIGDVYPFPRHVAEILIKEGSAVKA